MKKNIVVVAILALGLVSIVNGEPKTRSSASSAKIEHGKYLVENIGMCGDCHTPHNEKGEPIKEQWLTGTELPFKSTVPMPWAEKSVNIVGLPGWEHDAAVKFFMTGIAYNGLPARPPMPQYRYNHEDAEAVVAYLKSLGTSK
jgi:mono/diheme cytochrome c family protein